MPPIKKFKYGFTAVINDKIWHINVKRMFKNGRRIAAYEREHKEDL